MSGNSVYTRLILDYIKSLEELEVSVDKVAFLATRIHSESKKLLIEKRGNIRMSDALQDHIAMKRSIKVILKRSRQTLGILLVDQDLDKDSSNGKR